MTAEGCLQNRGKIRRASRPSGPPTGLMSPFRVQCRVGRYRCRSARRRDPGSCSWNMRSWYTVGASGWGDTYQEKVAAHELGHMIGLWDEYAGGAVDPLSHSSTWVADAHGQTLDYYYGGCWLDTDNRRSVSEPGTVLLIGARALLVAFFGDEALRLDAHHGLIGRRAK